MKIINYLLLLLTLFIFTEPTEVLADIKDFESSYQETNEPDPLPDGKHAVLYIYAVGNENPNLESLYITLNKKASHVIYFNTYSTFILPVGDCNIATVPIERFSTYEEFKPNKNYYLEIKNEGFFSIGLTSKKDDFEKIKPKLKKVKLIPGSKLANELNEYNKKLE